MTAACDPPAKRAHGVSSRNGHSHVELGHVVINLPRLDAGADTGDATAVRSNIVAGQELKLLQVMSPDAQRAPPCVSSVEVVARVPVFPC